MSARSSSARGRAPRESLSITRPPLGAAAIAVWHTWSHRCDSYGLDPKTTRDLIFNAGGL